MTEDVTKKFGVLARYILPTEQEERDCPEGVFVLVLLLRMLLGNTIDGVFYKTSWEVEDGCTHYTDLFIYDAGSKDRNGSLKQFANVCFDTAVSVEWGFENVGDFCPGKSSGGTIRGLYFGTILGGNHTDCAEAVMTLLKMAAITRFNRTLVIQEVEDGVASIKVRQYEGDEAKTIDIGFLRWLTVDTHCSRFYGNYGDCAFELA